MSKNEQQTLIIQGMSCASCVSKVEKALNRTPGVISASVNLASEKAYIITSQKVSVDTLIQNVESIGYRALKESQVSSKDSLENLKKEKLNLILSALLTFPLVVPMLLMPFGIHWMPSGEIQLLLTLPVQFGFGFRFYKGAWRALKSFSGNMDLLVAVGTSAAFGLSVYSLWSHSHEDMPPHLYFESAAVIITLVLFGKYLESKAKKSTLTAIEALKALRPQTARRVTQDGHSESEIPIEAIKVGDLLSVRAGESIAADGIVIEGQSDVDESMITGESLPVLKKTNDKVIAGSINQTGQLIVQTTAIGDESALAKIIRLVDQAQMVKAPIQRLVDQVSQYFVPVIFLIATFTILYWGLQNGDWETALINGVSVLVIACPCALGLATPTSIIVGSGLAAKNGILIQDAQALERAHKITVVAFDKTGTLTRGQPTLKYIKPTNTTEEELLRLSASLQSSSEHSLGQAVVKEAQERSLSLTAPKNVSFIAGKGLIGDIENQTLLIGNKGLMLDHQIDISEHETILSSLIEDGTTVSLVARKHPSQILGILGFQDEVKPTSKQTVEALKKRQIKTLMITGDNIGSAKRIADQLGIQEYYAEVLPEHKSKLINQLKKHKDVVAMVGDGINDAPALTAADIGFAMSTGTDVALHAADITLMQGDPLLIPSALDISARTFKKIKQNLFWAFIYNVIGVPLAAMGILNPMIAGGAMALSSVSVVLNSLTLKRWKKL